MSDFEQLKNEIIRLSAPVFRKHSMTYESDWAYAVTKEESDLMALGELVGINWNTYVEFEDMAKTLNKRAKDKTPADDKLMRAFAVIDENKEVIDGARYEIEYMAAVAFESSRALVALADALEGGGDE